MMKESKPIPLDHITEAISRFYFALKHTPPETLGALEDIKVPIISDAEAFPNFYPDTFTRNLENPRYIKFKKIDGRWHITEFPEI